MVVSLTTTLGYHSAKVNKQSLLGLAGCSTLPQESNKLSSWSTKHSVHEISKTVIETTSSCDGSDLVTYNKYRRTYSNGSTDTQEETSRETNSSKCKTTIDILFEDKSYNGGFTDDSVIAYIYYNNSYKRKVPIYNGRTTPIVLDAGEVLYLIEIAIYNSGRSTETFRVLWDGSVETTLDASSLNTGIATIRPNIKYSDGSSTHYIEVWD